MKKISQIINCLFSSKTVGNNIKYIRKNDLPANSVAGFINHATHDYIAARSLLRQGIAGPGTILAVTALEKIMKSFLLESGDKVRRDGKGHNIKMLMDQIVNLNNTFLSPDERKFIIHINTAYKLRYPTEINESFETFLPSLKILVNLDSLFHKFIKSNVLDTINKNSKWYDMFEQGYMPKTQLVQQNVNFGADRNNIITSQQWFVGYYSTAEGCTSIFKQTDSIKDDNDWKMPSILKT